jgi:hypothetical protein
VTAAARRAWRVPGPAAVAEREADNGSLTGEELDAARSGAGLTAGPPDCMTAAVYDAGVRRASGACRLELVERPRP